MSGQSGSQGVSLDDLNLMYEKFKSEVDNEESRAEVLNIKSRYMGKKGALSEVLKSMKNLSGEERIEIGGRANELKGLMSELVDKKITDLEISEINQELMKQKIDVTKRASLFDRGLVKAGTHPTSQIQQEIEDIFLSMGFEVLDGPHVEDEYHNFEALNIPSSHPARDMQDTFWFEHPHTSGGNAHLLRTHTSTIQIRGMKDRKPPFRFIAPGKVFRCERTDASHEMAFHQLEGMMVGKNVSTAHLIYFMKTLLSQVFGKDVDVRLRPGFFPFVEPGFELDIKCLICGGKGCSVCKQVGWVELLPCGMVHPNVLKMADIDPEEYNGFAFGLGLDRLVMMRYGVDDIRHLHSGDLRFVSQFSTY